MYIMYYIVQINIERLVFRVLLVQVVFGIRRLLHFIIIYVIVVIVIVVIVVVIVVETDTFRF